MKKIFFPINEIPGKENAKKLFAFLQKHEIKNFDPNEGFRRF